MDPIPEYSVPTAELIEDIRETRALRVRKFVFHGKIKVA